MSDSRHAIFARLFAESRSALHRYVRRLVRSRDAADEIVQEAFLRTYARGDSLRTPRAFLFWTARNLVSDRRRRTRLAPIETVGDVDELRVVSSCDPLEDQLIVEEASRLLKAVVARLPPRCRAAFVLKVFHGCSYKEIGHRLGLSERTVEKHIASGLLKAHAYLRLRYPQKDFPSTTRKDAAPAARSEVSGDDPQVLALEPRDDHE